MASWRKWLRRPKQQVVEKGSYETIRPNSSCTCFSNKKNSTKNVFLWKQFDGAGGWLGPYLGTQVVRQSVLFCDDSLLPEINWHVQRTHIPRHTRTRKACVALFGWF